MIEADKGSGSVSVKEKRVRPNQKSKKKGLWAESSETDTVN